MFFFRVFKYFREFRVWGFEGLGVFIEGFRVFYVFMKVFGFLGFLRLIFWVNFEGFWFLVELYGVLGFLGVFSISLGLLCDFRILGFFSGV